MLLNLKAEVKRFIKSIFLTLRMQIELPKETSSKLSKASKVLGIEDKEIVDRAIIVYLDSIEKMLELKREMKDWDALSDEALISFEKSL